MPFSRQPPGGAGGLAAEPGGRLARGADSPRVGEGLRGRAEVSCVRAEPHTLTLFQEEHFAFAAARLLLLVCS